jgi:hypothetical protein
MKTNHMLKWMVPLAAGALILGGCALSKTTSSGTSTSTADTSAGAGSADTTSNTTASYATASSSPSSTSYAPAEGEVAISLSDGASSCASSNVTIDNAKNQIVITAVGTYVLSGSLSDGSILITAEATTAEDTVELILNGVSIANKGTTTYAVSSSTGTTTIYPGPIYSIASAHLDVKALKDSSSVILDSRKSSLALGDDSAAIFSNKKLQIKGAGSLNVTSTYNNGLVSDSKVEAAKATLSVTAYGHAIKAHDSVILGGAEDLGSFTLASTEADGTCVRVDEDNEVATPVYGNNSADDAIAGIEIKDGAYVISSKGNAISSEAHVYLEGGNGTISSSAGKGVKAELNLFVDGGDFTIKTPTDDCLHASTGSVTATGGTYTLTSGTSDGCQGIKGEEQVSIAGGSFTITSSYEGIAAHKISVSGGMTSVISSDDGWSAGGSNEQTSSACAIAISGGTNYVYAGGDGLDSNGSFAISGGTTIVAAPSSGGNGPLDSGDGYSVTVTGGNVIAYGVTGMTEALAGTQNSVVLYSHAAFSQGNYYVIVQGANEWAVKATRATNSTMVCSLSDFTSGSVAIYEASAVTVSSTLFAQGYFNKISAYTSAATLYSGSFSGTTSSHLTSGSSQGGGGGGQTPGGGGPGGR